MANFMEVDLQQGDFLGFVTTGKPCPGWNDISRNTRNVDRADMILERVARGAGPIKWLFFGRIASPDD